jgi:hypothetical protein
MDLFYFLRIRRSGVEFLAARHLKQRVYNPNKGDTFLHQNSKALNQRSYNPKKCLTQSRKERRVKALNNREKAFILPISLSGLAPALINSLRVACLCLGYRPVNQKINAKKLRKAKKDTKGNCFRFLKYFFFAVFLYHSAPLR